MSIGLGSLDGHYRLVSRTQTRTWTAVNELNDGVSFSQQYHIDFWDLPYLLWYLKYTESTVHLIISKHVNIEIPYLKKKTKLNKSSLKSHSAYGTAEGQYAVLSTGQYFRNYRAIIIIPRDPGSELELIQLLELKYF